MSFVITRTRPFNLNFNIRIRLQSESLRNLISCFDFQLNPQYSSRFELPNQNLLIIYYPPLPSFRCNASFGFTFTAFLCGILVHCYHYFNFVCLSHCVPFIVAGISNSTYSWIIARISMLCDSEPLIFCFSTLLFC